MGNELNLDQTRAIVNRDSDAAVNGNAQAAEALLKDLLPLSNDQRSSVLKENRFLARSHQAPDDFTVVEFAKEPYLQKKSSVIIDFKRNHVFHAPQEAKEVKDLARSAITSERDSDLRKVADKVHDLSPIEIEAMTREISEPTPWDKLNGYNNLLIPKFLTYSFTPELLYDSRQLQPYERQVLREFNYPNSDTMFFFQKNKVLAVGPQGAEIVRLPDVKRIADEIAHKADDVFSASSKDKQSVQNGLAAYLQKEYSRAPIQTSFALKLVDFEACHDKKMNPNDYTCGNNPGPSAWISEDRKSVKFLYQTGTYEKPGRGLSFQISLIPGQFSAEPARPAESEKQVPSKQIPIEEHPRNPEPVLSNRMKEPPPIQSASPLEKNSNKKEPPTTSEPPQEHSQKDGQGKQLNRNESQREQVAPNSGKPEADGKAPEPTKQIDGVKKDQEHVPHGHSLFDTLLPGVQDFLTRKVDTPPQPGSPTDSTQETRKEPPIDPAKAPIKDSGEPTTDPAKKSKDKTTDSANKDRSHHHSGKHIHKHDGDQSHHNKPTTRSNEEPHIVKKSPTQKNQHHDDTPRAKRSRRDCD